MQFIKVKFRKSHPEFAYYAGDIGSVTEESAAKLLESGHIILLPEDEIEEKENTLPEDLPGRDKLFAAGFGTIESVKEAGESVSDVLNKTELKKLNTYFEGSK